MVSPEWVQAKGGLHDPENPRNRQLFEQARAWAEWCATHLDRAIVRGTRREITAREHLSPETYSAVMDKARETVREAPQTALAMLARTDLTHHDAHELRDYLLLRGERLPATRPWEPPTSLLEPLPGPTTWR